MKNIEMLMHLNETKKGIKFDVSFKGVLKDFKLTDDYWLRDLEELIIEKIEEINVKKGRL